MPREGRGEAMTDDEGEPRGAEMSAGERRLNAGEGMVRRQAGSEERRDAGPPGKMDCRKADWPPARTGRGTRNEGVASECEN